MKQATCLLAVFSLVALTGAMAQTGVDGAILGVVTDTNGGAVVGATVTVTKRLPHNNIYHINAFMRC